VELLPGSSPSPTQIMPCCMAKIAIWMRLLSLSPFWLAELVKPAASLSFHSRRDQSLEVDSMKVLNAADRLPM